MKLGGMGTRAKLLLGELGDVIGDPVDVATDCEAVGDFMLTAGTIVTAGLEFSAGFLSAAILFV